MATPCCNIQVKKNKWTILNWKSKMDSTARFRFNAHSVAGICYLNAKCFATKWARNQKKISYGTTLNIFDFFNFSNRLERWFNLLNKEHLNSGTMKWGTRGPVTLAWTIRIKKMHIEFDAFISIYLHSTYRHECKRNWSFFPDFSVVVEETYFRNKNKQFQLAQLAVFNAHKNKNNDTKW